MLDLRYAFRSLWHAKGFTLAAVLTLVLGIGVNLAVFTIVDRALFRALPFGHMDRLVCVNPFSPENGSTYYSFNKRLFLEARASIPAIEDMGFAAFTAGFRPGTDPDTPATLALTEVSFNLLDVLGTVPALGRGFQQADVDAGRQVAMLTFEAWHAQFGGAEAVIGAFVSNTRSTATIIGILPPGFIVPATNRAGSFHGLYLDQDRLVSAEPREAVAPSVARLAPGMTIDLAQQQLDALAERLEPDLRRSPDAPGPRLLVQPLRAGMFWFVYRYLWLAAAAAALVGLLACANFSNLLLARGRSRETQAAVRLSLGATPARLMASEITQALLVCGIATIGSVLLLVWSAEALRALVPTVHRPFVLGAVDGRVLAFGLIATLVVSVAASIWPTWRASRTDLLAVIQRGAGTPVHARRTRSGGAFVAFEAAVGLVLVVAAAVVVRSFVGLVTTDVGFEREGLHRLRVEFARSLQETEPVVELARHRNILDTIRQRPEVVSAAFADSLPASGEAPMRVLTWNGSESMGLFQVADRFFETLQIETLAGRVISREDVDATRPVAVVSRTAARLLWPDEPLPQVLGRRLSAPEQPDRTIVGVVADVRDQPREAPDPRVFVPVGTEGWWSFDFAVRTADGAVSGEALQAQLGERFGITSIRAAPYGAWVESFLQQPRNQAVIFGSFGAVALLLAAVGLFAVASFDVALRQYEMGVRTALGASTRQIRRLVLATVLRPVLIGLAAGLAAAWWAAGLLQSLVHQVDPRDPWTLALGAGVLLGTATVAAWVPASRAAKTDPAVVLRAE